MTEEKFIEEMVNRGYMQKYYIREYCNPFLFLGVLYATSLTVLDREIRAQK